VTGTAGRALHMLADEFSGTTGMNSVDHRRGAGIASPAAAGGNGRCPARSSGRTRADKDDEHVGTRPAKPTPREHAAASPAASSPVQVLHHVVVEEEGATSDADPIPPPWPEEPTVTQAMATEAHMQRQEFTFPDSDAWVTQNTAIPNSTAW